MTMLICLLFSHTFLFNWPKVIIKNYSNLTRPRLLYQELTEPGSYFLFHDRNSDCSSKLLCARNWNTFYKPAYGPSQCSNCYACTPLKPIQPLGTCKLFQELYHDYLKKNSHPNYSQKQLVFKDAFKYILLFKLSRVKFIEYLAEHKTVEYEGVIHFLFYSKDWLTFKL